MDGISSILVTAFAVAMTTAMGVGVWYGARWAAGAIAAIWAGARKKEKPNEKQARK